MDVLGEELIRFWKALNKNNVHHLIQNKKAVNRLKDQVDVIYLEKIKKILQEKDGKKGQTP